MAAPIVVQDTEYRSVYFPFVNWYDFNTGRKYPART
jgi:alpha-glucosidase (family GH31 glycosyl hydrolase)